MLMLIFIDVSAHVLWAVIDYIRFYAKTLEIMYETQSFQRISLFDMLSGYLIDLIYGAITMLGGIVALRLYRDKLSADSQRASV